MQKPFQSINPKFLRLQRKWQEMDCIGLFLISTKIQISPCSLHPLQWQMRIHNIPLFEAIQAEVPIQKTFQSIKVCPLQTKLEGTELSPNPKIMAGTQNQPGKSPLRMARRRNVATYFPQSNHPVSYHTLPRISEAATATP